MKLGHTRQIQRPGHRKRQGRLLVVRCGKSQAAQQLRLHLQALCLGLGAAAAILLAALGLAEDILYAAERAREEGYFGSVCAETGTFDFPEREYAGVVEAILANNEEVVEYGQPLVRIK